MPVDIAHSTIGFYNNLRPQDTHVDERVGESDGRKNIPPSDSEAMSMHEISLVSQARTAQTRYLMALADKIEGLRKQVDIKTGEYSTRLPAEKGLLNSRKQSELEKIDSTSGDNSPRMKALKEASESSSMKLQSFNLNVGREPQLHLHNPMFARFTPYFLILATLSFLEIPVNWNAIEAFLQQSQILTFGIAALVGAIYMTLAHILGVTIIRRRDIAEKIGEFPFWVGALGAFGLAAAITYLLFLMRDTVGLSAAPGLITPLASSAAEFFSGPAAIGVDNVETMSAQGIAAKQTLIAATANYLLTTLNAAVFVIGAALSIFRHDPHPDYEPLLMSARRNLEALNTFSTAHAEKKAVVTQTYDHRISTVETLIAEAKKTALRLEDEIGRQQMIGDNDLSLVRDGLLQQMMAYRTGNMKTRTTPPPAYFIDQDPRDITQLLTD